MAWEPNFEIAALTSIDRAAIQMINEAKRIGGTVYAEFNDKRLTCGPESLPSDIIDQFDAQAQERAGLELAASIIRDHKLACFEDLLRACEILMDCTREDEDRIRLARYDQCAVFVSMAINKAKGPPL